MRREFARERLGEAIHCELRGGISASSRLTVDAHHRRGVDDRTTRSLFDHDASSSLRAYEGCFNVEAHDLLEFFERVVDQLGA